MGLAVGDTEGAIASPLVVLSIRGVAEQVRAVVREGEAYDVVAYVLGMPFNMDGSAGTQANVTRKFGEELARQTGRDVFEWDERLSSKGADEYLRAAELTYGKRKVRRDAVAAQIILQSFLDARMSAELGSDVDED